MIKRRFIVDDVEHESVNKAIEFYKKKYNTDLVLADVGLMSTRRKYEKDNETYTLVEGYNVTFMISAKEDKQHGNN